MKNSKRLLSSVLAVVILMTTMITAMPVTSSAATSLLWPLPKEFTNRTCEFMQLSYGKYHRGIDISSSGIDGQPIYAVADGTVHRAQWIQAEGDTSGGYGYCVILYHPSLNIYSLYAHCSSMAVSAGQTVSAGDTIAYVGSTGFSSAAHLHFELLSYYNLTNTNALIDPTPGVNYTYYYNDHNTHSYDTYAYFGASHPHYSYYKCSCGEVQISSETNYYNSCDICLGYPSKPTLTIYTGTSTEDIMFLSSVADRATSYDFKVYDPVTNERIYATYGQSRLSTMQLPAGTYFARVVGINDALVNTDKYWGEYSDPVHFTVTEGTLEPANIVEYNGHTYELYLNRLSWHNAKAKCEELGGHLATVTSVEEQEIVATLADGKGAYLGATNENGTWEWITGEDFSYTNWVSGEPNNNGHLSENYLGVYTEGGWNDFDYINQNVSGFICEYDACSHESYEANYTVLATCTEDGFEERTCNDCGEVFSVTDPAIGHNYVSETFDATCTDTAIKKYTCQNCGDSYSEAIVTEELWSDWGEEYPEGVDSSKIEEKTQYRYSTKETTTSTNSSLDGWTKYDSVTTYGSWSGNLTTTTKPTASDTLQIVGTSTVYNYYHWCSQDYDGGYENLDSIQYGSNGHYHTVTTTSPMSAYSFSDKGGQQAYRNGTTACVYNFYIWFYAGTTTTYTYQTRTKTVTNYFYKWSDFSDWQDEEIIADDNTTVETRTVYRYLTNSPEALGHDWSEWILTDATCTEDGSNSRTCNRCGETESEVISAIGHSWGEWVTTESTCTDSGSNTRTCVNCGESEVEVIPMLDHDWSEWIQISAPTATEDGEQLRYCKTCKTSETEVIPATGEEEPEPEEPVDPNEPVITSVNNYTVTLNNITDIKEIRFAIGTYTTGSEVKAAEKNVTLDASTVAKYTVDGIFTYDLPWMGEYTFWVRYNDGTAYFLYTDVNDITPYVESYGVKLTVKDYAENYKDMWLAEGTWNSYSEIKNDCTGFKYQASANKLDLYAKTTHDFSYTLTNPGPYTILIRYNDGTTDVIHTELTVDYPEFSGNGLQITVQNIPDIKIIRTAYGHYESVGDIKTAAGVRNFSNKNDIKNAEDYMIQYREAGEVTLIVEYNNGYKHFYYHNIQPKSATMIQSKNTVMFDDLDGFVMIRYAKGSYTTSSQIKAAEGSKVIKSADLIDGYAIISDLEAGTYTFCVQFDDESYDYHTVTIE